MRILIIIFYLSLALLCSCLGKNDRSIKYIEINGCTIPELIIEEIKDSINLKLSELVENVDFIKLQTTPEVQISNGKWLIGSEHIIVFCQGQGLFQFSWNGSFIRKLAGFGTGPEEIMSPVMCTDSNNSTLYVSDLIRSNQILKIDLKSGRIIENIGTARRGRIQDMIMFNDTTLVIAPFVGDGHSSSNLFIYFQNVKGDFINGIPSFGEGGLFILGSNLLSKIGNQVNYKPAGSDTLFRVIEDMLNPYFIICSKESYNDDEPSGKKSFEVILETQGYLILKIFQLRVANSLRGSRPQDQKSHMIFFDKKEMKAYNISSFVNDFTGEKISSGQISIKNDNYFFMLIDAFSLIKIVEMQRSEPDNTIQGIDRLSVLANSSTENDNPVLLVGQFKLGNIIKN